MSASQKVAREGTGVLAENDAAAGRAEDPGDGRLGVPDNGVGQHRQRLLGRRLGGVGGLSGPAVNGAAPAGQTHSPGQRAKPRRLTDQGGGD